DALIQNEKVKATYCRQVGDTFLFKLDEFIQMLRYKNYWDSSYTAYKNEVGLTAEGKYLKYNTDIVLDFPHKDCVLEAGMTKEDVTRQEVYYHHILAKEEIDTLLAPKVLSNIKRYDENGVTETTVFSETDNLILKGNNLLALASLLERYEGQVKCVYIDPPYNPDSAANTFSYN